MKSSHTDSEFVAGLSKTTLVANESGLSTKPRSAYYASKAAIHAAFETSKSRSFFADVHNFFTVSQMQKFAQLGIDFTNSHFCELLVFVIRIARASDVFDMSLACFDYLRHNLSLETFIQKAKFYMSFVRKAALEFYEGFREEMVHESATPFADRYGELLGVFSKFTSCELFESFKRFILSLASLKFFDKDLSKKIFRTTGERPTSELEAINSVLKSFHTLLSCGERLCKGESLPSILASDDPYGDFQAEAKRLIAMKDFTYIGKPVSGYIHRTEFSNAVDTTLRAGAKLVKVTPKNSPQYPPIFGLHLKLTQVSCELQNAVHGERRMTPFAIKLVGAPGVGKSTIFDYVVKMHSRALGREYSDEYVYHRNIASDYWEGLRPLSQDVYHYSEAGNTAKKIAMSQSDPVLMEITSLIDSLPMAVNMAAIESKGNTFVCPSLVIADINDANMNASFQVNNPAAFHRRWMTIEVSVKPEFRMPSSMQLDSQKCLDQDHNDFWNFRVTTFRASTSSTGVEQVEIEKASLAQLRDFLIPRMIQHYERQAAVLEKTRTVNIDAFQDHVPDEEEVINESGIMEYIDTLVPQQFVFSETKSALAQWLKFSFLSWTSYFMPESFYRYFVPTIKRHFVHKLFDRSAAYRSRFWESLGYQPTHSHAIPTSRYSDLALLLSVVINVLALCMFARNVQTNIFGQGAVMSSVSDRDEEEIKRAVQKYEQAVGVSTPRKSKRTSLNRDWFETDSTALKYLKNKETTNEPEHINKRALRNLRHFTIDIEIDGVMKEVRTRGFGICEDFIVLNKHPIFGRKEFTLTHVSEFGTVLRTYNVQQYFEMGTDLILARVPGDKFVDVRKILLDNIQFTSSSVAGYIADLEGVPTRIYPSDDQVINFFGRDNLQKDLLKYPWDGHAYGKCGTPVLAQLGRSYGVIGIHAAGSKMTHFGYCQRIDPSLVTEGIQFLSKASPYLRVNSEGEVRMDNLVKEPHKRSPLRYEGCERIQYVGTVPGNVPPTKSNLKKSKLFDKVYELFEESPFDENGDEKYGPPLMRGITVDGKYHDPESNFYRKLDKPGKALDPKIMDRVIAAISEHIISGLEEKGVTSLSPVDIFTAQNGYSENYYMRTMKNATSGGYPWPGSKRKYLDEDPREGKPDGKMPKSEVLDHLLYQIGAYAKNEDACPLLGAQLKDEARSAKKNKTAQTRVFMMSPYESTLLQRSLLLPFYTLMCEFSDIFCCSLGINMHSTDVDDFVQELLEFAPKLMEGDYGGFDTSMPYEIGLAANTIIYLVCEYFGYNEEALRQLKGMLSDNLFPTCVVKGDIIRVPSLQPSGKFGTAEDNSLRGLIMLVYFYVHQFEEREPRTFFEQVKPELYGDDLLSAVKDESINLFNNITYAEFCETVYGIEYTNAQKSKDFKPYLTIGETSFLKRSFVYRDDLKHWVAPLDKTSIMKSVAYILPSKVVSEEEQTLDALVSAMREMYFHTPEEEYEVLRHRVAAIAEELFNLAPNEFLKRLPTFWNITASLFQEETIVSESEVQEKTPNTAVHPFRSLGHFTARLMKRAVNVARAVTSRNVGAELSGIEESEYPILYSIALFYGVPAGLTALHLLSTASLHYLLGWPKLAVFISAGIVGPIAEELIQHYFRGSAHAIGFLETFNTWDPGHYLFHVGLRHNFSLWERITIHVLHNCFTCFCCLFPYGVVIASVSYLCVLLYIIERAVHNYFK